MTITGHWRGHTIEYMPEENHWMYANNGKPVPDNPHRTCKKCGIRAETADDPDPCLGLLPGVRNACCGHGDPSHSYIQFENGAVVRGFNIVEPRR